MPRKGRGSKFNRGGPKAKRGGAAAGPSSLHIPTASGTSRTVATQAATTTTRKDNSSNNNNSNTATAMGTSLPTLNRLRMSSPSSGAGSDLRGSSRTQSSVPPTPAFLAPPRRVHPNAHLHRAVDPRQEAEMRRIYNSGADQVLAKPPPKLNVTLHLSWPAPMRGFKDIDPADDDVETLLARIASEHDAKVEAEEQDAAVSVTIMAMNRAKAQEVIAAVRKQFLYRPGEESVWRVQLVVNPPKDGSNCLTAVLKSRKDATGRRITAVTNKNRMPADGVSLTETKTGYKKALIKMLDEVASHLRHNPNGMQMRVHFGMLVLNEWKKDKNEYSLPELDSMVSRAGTRGTTYFSNKLSEVAAKALAARLTRSNTELPEKLRSFLKRDDTDEDGDPKVIYSMALTTKNLIVESKFEKVDTQRLRNGQGVQYSLGPLEVELGEKQDPAAEFITVCPESDYDWALMIRKIAGNKATKASPPFDVPMLQKNFSFTGQRIGEEGFPYFKIPDSFLRLYDIGNVHGKVMLQYSLGLKYTLEIALVYDLGNQKKVPEHATTATVVLHSPDWDYEMFSDASVPRPWNDSFDEHFFKPFDHDRGPGGQAADPLDHFLLWIDWIQKGLDSASQESDETAGQAA